MADRSKNPKNDRNGLFRQLTRLLSGPIVQRRRQHYRREKRRDLNKYEPRFKSASGQKLERHTHDPFAHMASKMLAEQTRAQRYGDFEQMEYTPEIASALDIYADEMTTYSPLTQMLNIDCKNSEIKSILNELYYNTLNIKFNLFGWARTMCKYGDFFLYLDIDESMGITNAIGLPSREVERMEGEDKTNPNYVQFQWNSGGLTFENWQVAHFRILGNDKYTPYGSSVLEAARRIWRQLTLLEDAMMAYRIVRSPERRIFKIEVGNIAPQDVEQYIQKVMTSMKRNQVIDKDTGRVDLRYNPLSVEEDYFIPVRGGQGSDIQSLPGGTYTGDIDDVKYLQNKLFSALKIPPSYLARGEAVAEDTSTLAQKDIRFARTVQRLQRAMVSELEKIGIVHLYTLGFRGDDLVSFSLFLNNPSKIAELQELEHWRTKFEIGSAATDGFFSRRWVATNLFGLTDEEFLRNQREIYFDRFYMADLEKVAAETAEDSMDMGPGPGGGFEPSPEDLEFPETPPEEGELGAEPEPEEEEPGSLLATPPEPAPALRDDGYITNGSKGKIYHPKKKGFDQREKAIPRKRNMLSKAGNEISSASKRNITFNLASKMKSTVKPDLSKGIFENVKHNYNYEEEQKLFKLNYDLENMVKSLEKLDNDSKKEEN